MRVGYAELHCNTVIFFFLFFFKIFNAFSISFKVDAPVDNKIFLFLVLIYLSNGKFVISPEGILIKSTPLIVTNIIELFQHNILLFMKHIYKVFRKILKSLI